MGESRVPAGAESLPAEERRQLIQIVDAFIKRDQLKRRASNRTSGQERSEP